MTLNAQALAIAKEAWIATLRGATTPVSAADCQAAAVEALLAAVANNTVATSDITREWAIRTSQAVDRDEVNRSRQTLARLGNGQLAMLPDFFDTLPVVIGESGPAPARRYHDARPPGDGPGAAGQRRGGPPRLRGVAPRGLHRVPPTVGTTRRLQTQAVAMTRPLAILLLAAVALLASAFTFPSCGQEQPSPKPAPTSTAAPVVATATPTTPVPGTQTPVSPGTTPTPTIPTSTPPGPSVTATSAPQPATPAPAATEPGLPPSGQGGCLTSPMPCGRGAP